MDELKKQHSNTAITGSLLSTYVHYCARSYVDQRACADPPVFSPECLTKAQELELVAFFRDWVQRTSSSTISETFWSTAELTRGCNHPSLAGWYWTVLLWLSVLKHQPECAEQWAVDAVKHSLQQLDDVAARTHANDGSWDRQGVVASIVGLMAEALCRDSLPQDLLLSLYRLLTRLQQQDGPETAQAAAQAASTKLQTLAATAMVIVKLLESPRDDMALAGCALAFTLLSKTTYLAAATPEQLQLAGRLLNRRLRCIAALHRLGHLEAEPVLRKDLCLTCIPRVLVLSCYATLAEHRECRPAQVEDILHLAIVAIQQSVMQADERGAFEEHERDATEQAILCIWRLYDAEAIDPWKALAVFVLHIITHDAYGLRPAAEEIAVRVLRRIWTDAEAADIMLGVRTEHLPHLWPCVARCWSKHPLLREPIARMLHTKLVEHAGFAACVPKEPGQVWRPFGFMLHVEMEKGTSMPSRVHLLLFLLSVLHNYANERDRMFSKLDPDVLLIPAIAQILQQLLEDDPASSEHQGWVDELMEACRKVLITANFRCAKLQPVVLHLGAELIAQRSLPEDVSGPAVHSIQERGAFVLSALSACPAYAERLVALCSVQDMCLWPVESIGAFSKNPDVATMDSRTYVFIECRMYVMMALFTAAPAGGCNLMSQLDDRRLFAELLLRSFINLLEELDPLSLSRAKPFSARHECQKAAICLRIFETTSWRGFLNASQKVDLLDACIMLLSKLPDWVVPFQGCRLPEGQKLVLHDAIRLGGPALTAMINWIKHKPALANSVMRHPKAREFPALLTLPGNHITLADKDLPASVLAAAARLQASITAQVTADAEAAAALLLGEEEARKAAAATKAEKRRRQQAQRQAARHPASTQSAACPAASNQAQQDQQAADASPGLTGATSLESDEHACSPIDPATVPGSQERESDGGAAGSATNAAICPPAASADAGKDAGSCRQDDHTAPAACSQLSSCKGVVSHTLPADVRSLADYAEVASGLARLAMASDEVPPSRSRQPRCPLPSQPQVAAPVPKLDHTVGQPVFDIEDICCPITQEVMRDPVIAEDGHTYERSAIAAWLAKSNTSPMTGMPLPHKAGASLIPNIVLRRLIEWRTGAQAAGK